MPDDLDETLRGAMKTLDEQVPSGYFDALPNQILARLEDGSMQHGSSTSTVRDKRDALTGPPVVAAPVVAKTEAKAEAMAEAKSERSEDSGLHDIRNLAQSTKQRLSSRRITQNPPMSDDDVLASSSGSWKNIALPEPAKMVSLPDIASLPSKAELLAAEKAAEKRLAEQTKQKAKAKKADKGAPMIAPSDDVLAPVASANAALDSLTAKPALELQAFSLPSQRNKRSKGPLVAILGLGLAAAAGGVIYSQMDSKAKAPAVVAASDTAVAQAPAAPAKAEPPPAPAVVAPAPEVAAAAVAEPAVEEAKADEAPAEETKSTKAGKRGAVKGKKAPIEKAEPAAKPEPKVEEKKTDLPKPEGKKAGGGEGEPSFDALLKEAGVEDKKEAAPKLDKKSLSGEDFKKGMAGVAGKAQGCYKGNQGTAMVKLTVGPSGKVTKVSVAGQFAGTPEASCVESAVKSAAFPPWDGGPQSFSYSYMLSD